MLCNSKPFVVSQLCIKDYLDYCYYMIFCSFCSVCLPVFTFECFGNFSQTFDQSLFVTYAFEVAGIFNIVKVVIVKYIICCRFKSIIDKGRQGFIPTNTKETFWIIQMNLDSRNCDLRKNLDLLICNFKGVSYVWNKKESRFKKDFLNRDLTVLFRELFKGTIFL